MKKLPKISESEWLVMRELWSKGALTANDIVRQIARKRKWKPRTIKTLITRLVKKGAVEFSKEGRRYRYRAVVTEEQCTATERRWFVQRVYGGTMKPMLAAFIEDAKLSGDDISELKTILDQKGKG